MSFFDPTEQEERSFLSVLRHTVLEGELKLVRFSDSRRGHTGAWGSFWMYASEIAELMGAASQRGPFGHAMIRDVKERWAICDDWGDLGRMWVMTIPSGSTLNAYFGFAKFQPTISAPRQRYTGKNSPEFRMGGSIQLVTRVGEMQKKWIQGPFRTIDVSSKALA
jgi:hypothetical protein